MATIDHKPLAECVALWGEPEQTVVGVSNHWTGTSN